MSPEQVIIGFALVALLASTVQTAVGFASTVLFVTLGTHLMPIRQVVALAVLVTLVQTSYVVIRHHPGVRWRMLATRIVPLMLVGGVFGYVGVRAFAGPWLERTFAAMVVLLAARELFRMSVQRAGERPFPKLASNGIITLAGVIHGAYATGGPTLVYAVGRELEKREMRATLSMVWLILDGILTISFALDGTYTASTLEPLWLLPIALPLGVVLGEQIHRRVEERHFKLGLFALLLVAGITLFVRV